MTDKKALPAWMSVTEPVKRFDSKAPPQFLPGGPQKEDADREGWSRTFRDTIARQQAELDSLRALTRVGSRIVPAPNPKWLGDVLSYIDSAAQKHPGAPPARSYALNLGELKKVDKICREMNDGCIGSWQTAILEEACEYASETGQSNARVELLQLIAVAVRALVDMDEQYGNCYDPDCDCNGDCGGQ